MTGVDTTVFAAFAAGFISFISPCVLPLVPGYLSAVSGVSVAELEERDRSRAAVLFPAIIFCLSFTAVFVALGMVATGLGSTLRDNRDLLNQIAGALIVLMGLLFIGTLFITRLNAEWRPHGLIARAGAGGPMVAGAAFAIGWTPCIGPTLTAILAVAATGDTADGAALLIAYSLGLGVPFLLAGLGLSSMVSAIGVLRRHGAWVNRIGGTILVVVGILLLTGQLTELTQRLQNTWVVY